MFVTAFTGSASIFRRPPDISSTLAFQRRKYSWKMSLPAHPDWTFQVTDSCCVIGVVGAGAPTPGVPAAVATGAGAFWERHAVASDASPETDAYLSRLRRSKRGNPTSTTSLVATRPANMRDRGVAPVKGRFSLGGIRRASPQAAERAARHGGAKRAVSRLRRSGVAGVDAVGVDPMLADGPGDLRGRELLGHGEPVQGSDDHVSRVDLEVAAQRLAGIAAPEPVRPQRDERLADPARDLVGHRLHVVARGHDGPAPADALGHEGSPWLRFGM